MSSEPSAARRRVVAAVFAVSGRLESMTDPSTSPPAGTRSTRPANWAEIAFCAAGAPAGSLNAPRAITGSGSA
ncbi:hypothetical protein, partial [Saccharothrix longispora]|uniref:hypothetical protein n=1 Tax=Saccharothrix longispora TaxID=33920 RepID=UPI0028FD3C18